MVLPFRIAPTVQKILEEAYIIGGSPCSGKSTHAGRLALDNDLQYYKIDDYQEAHIQRCRPDHHPALYNYLQMDWQTRWMRPISKQVDEVFHVFRERFEMMLDDLVEYDPYRDTVIEGTFSPDLIASYRVKRERILFMIPSKDFQVGQYRQRAWISPILAACADPDRAFKNWIARDQAYGRQIARQAGIHGFPLIIVDGSKTVVELYEKIKALMAMV